MYIKESVERVRRDSFSNDQEGELKSLFAQFCHGKDAVRA